MQMPTAEGIEAQAKEYGISINALCRRADINTATFYRWRAGRTVVLVTTIKKLLDALEEMKPHG